MISFAFTAEQEDFRRQLRKLAETELAPRYIERAATTDFFWDAHRQLGELGVLGLGLPEKYGGSGEDDPITLGMACEALDYGDVNVAAAPVQVGLVAAHPWLVAHRHPVVHRAAPGEPSEGGGGRPSARRDPRMRTLRAVDGLGLAPDRVSGNHPPPHSLG